MSTVVCGASLCRAGVTCVCALCSFSRLGSYQRRRRDRTEDERQVKNAKRREKMKHKTREDQRGEKRREEKRREEKRREEARQEKRQDEETEMKRGDFFQKKNV